jgi:MYXO-CTERM domain-containing protein
MRGKARLSGRVHGWTLVLVASTTGFLLAGCSPDGTSGTSLADEDTTQTPYPVVGGEVAPVCSVPMNVKISGCTATLLTPTILVTAKHCGPKAGATVQFGEAAPFAFSVTTVKCVSAKDSDAAYCVLPDDERLKHVPVVPVLHGCEYTKFMKPGARVLGVGFGQTMGTGPSRTKSLVEVPVAKVRDPSISVGDQTHDLCFGDSGGGAFIHLVEGDKDWGWRLIGTVTGTTSGVKAPCGGTGYTSILRHIKLIEETEKIDITPCTDAQGAWAPGPDCKDFLTDIKTGGGMWPACNPGPHTTLAIDSCAAGPGPAASDGGPSEPSNDAGRANTGGRNGGAKPDASTGADATGSSGSGGRGAGGNGSASGGSAGSGNTAGAAGDGAGGSSGGNLPGTGGAGPSDAAEPGSTGSPGTKGAANAGSANQGGGCAVGGAPPGASAAWALALLGLLFARRRRDLGQ